MLRKKTVRRSEKSLVSVKAIGARIFVLRGHRVMLDRDLAALFGVETRTLNQAAKRNIERFPDEFMFRLSMEESQRVLDSRSQIVILKRGHTVVYAARRVRFVFVRAAAAFLAWSIL